MKTPDDFAAAMRERQADPTKVAKRLPEDVSGWRVGLIFLACSLGGMGYCYLVLSEASTHVEKLSYSSQIIFATPLLFLMGVTMLVLREKHIKVMGPTTAPSPVGWLAAVVFIALSFAFCYGFKHYLRTLGYDTGVI